MRSRSVFPILLLAFWPFLVSAQERPRIGLVLSGGSAKGFGHLGVIETLEELGVPIDIVTGVSMGGLIGGLYATGFQSRQIEQIAKQQDWAALFSDEPERGFITPDRRVLSARTVLEVPLQGGRIGLPGGLVRGQNILRLLQRLTWRSQMVHDFTQLPRPFAAIATNLETGAAVVLDSGAIAEAMRATISVPGGIEPYRLNGQVLVDGGLSRNLPAQDARALGADILICSDVTEAPSRAEDVRSALDVLFQSIALGLERGTEPERKLCNVLIRPDMKDMSSIDFGHVDEWTRRGRVATLEVADELRPYAYGDGNRMNASAFQRYIPDSVRVTNIRIVGVREDARQIARRTIDLPAPTFVSALSLDEALARLYATDLFSQAIYRLERRDSDTTLVFELRQEARDELGLGFRYDDHRKAALLLTGTFHNFMRYGSRTLLELRLGDESLIGARFLPRFGAISPLSVGVDARHTRAVFDLWRDDERVAQVRSRVTEVSGLFGFAVGPSSIIGVRPGLELTDAGTTISTADTSQTELHAVVFASVFRSTLDRDYHPSRGTLLLIQSGAAAPLSDVEGYTQSYASIEHVAPIARRTALRARAIIGVAASDDLPFHRFFYLGGAYPSAIFGESHAPFWGLRPEQHMGKGLQVVRLSLQQGFARRMYVTLGGNVGNTFPEWEFDPEDYIGGWGIALGAASAMGPIEITLHGRSLADWPLVDFNIGFRF